MVAEVGQRPLPAVPLGQHRLQAGAQGVVGAAGVVGVVGVVGLGRGRPRVGLDVPGAARHPVLERPRRDGQGVGRLLQARVGVAAEQVDDEAPEAVGVPPSSRRAAHAAGMVEDMAQRLGGEPLRRRLGRGLGGATRRPDEMVEGLPQPALELVGSTPARAGGPQHLVDGGTGQAQRRQPGDG